MWRSWTLTSQQRRVPTIGGGSGGDAHTLHSPPPRAWISTDRVVMLPAGPRPGRPSPLFTWTIHVARPGGASCLPESERRHAHRCHAWQGWRRSHTPTLPYCFRPQVATVGGGDSGVDGGGSGGGGGRSGGSQPAGAPTARNYIKTPCDAAGGGGARGGRGGLWSRRGRSQKRWIWRVGSTPHPHQRAKSWLELPSPPLFWRRWTGAQAAVKAAAGVLARGLGRARGLCCGQKSSVGGAPAPTAKAVGVGATS